MLCVLAPGSRSASVIVAGCSSWRALILSANIRATLFSQVEHSPLLMENKIDGSCLGTKSGSICVTTFFNTRTGIVIELFEGSIVIVPSESSAASVISGLDLKCHLPSMVPEEHFLPITPF